MKYNKLNNKWNDTQFSIRHITYGFVSTYGSTPKHHLHILSKCLDQAFTCTLLNILYCVESQITAKRILPSFNQEGQVFEMRQLHIKAIYAVVYQERTPFNKWKNVDHLLIFKSLRANYSLLHSVIKYLITF